MAPNATHCLVAVNRPPAGQAVRPTTTTHTLTGHREGCGHAVDAWERVDPHDGRRRRGRPSVGHSQGGFLHKAGRSNVRVGEVDALEEALGRRPGFIPAGPAPLTRRNVDPSRRTSLRRRRQMRRLGLGRYERGYPKPAEVQGGATGTPRTSRGSGGGGWGQGSGAGEGAHQLMAQLAQLAVAGGHAGREGRHDGRVTACRSRRTVCTSRPPERTAGCGYGPVGRREHGDGLRVRPERREEGDAAGGIAGRFARIVPRATATCSCLTRSAPVGRRAIEAMAMTKMITRRKRYGGRSEPAAKSGRGRGPEPSRSVRSKGTRRRRGRRRRKKRLTPAVSDAEGHITAACAVAVNGHTSEVYTGGADRHVLVWGRRRRVTRRRRTRVEDRTAPPRRGGWGAGRFGPTRSTGGSRAASSRGRPVTRTTGATTTAFTPTRTRGGGYTGWDTGAGSISEGLKVNHTRAHFRNWNCETMREDF